MAETGVAIAAARSELVRLLSAMIAKLPDDGPFPRAAITLDGAVERQVGERPAVEVEELLRTALASGRTRDRAAGRTLDGPHRADLLVRHSAKDMPAELCSTGEQKALLIGLVISHARLTAEIAGSAPILLLDEVAAHLDPGRRAALFAILDDLNCQTFMTGTEASLFSSLAGPRPVPDGVAWRGQPSSADNARLEPTMFQRMTRHETPPLSPQELERYARHIVLPEIGGAGQQRLKRARVLVIGAGGLGAPVLEYLAAAGVGTLGLVDDDIVSLSNLQRQVIHDTQAVGLAKTESAASGDRPHQSACVGRDRTRCG